MTGPRGACARRSSRSPRALARRAARSAITVLQTRGETTRPRRGAVDEAARRACRRSRSTSASRDDRRGDATCACGERCSSRGKRGRRRCDLRALPLAAGADRRRVRPLARRRPRRAEAARRLASRSAGRAAPSRVALLLVGAKRRRRRGAGSGSRRDYPDSPEAVDGRGHPLSGLAPGLPPIVADSACRARRLARRPAAHPRRATRAARTRTAKLRYGSRSGGSAPRLGGAPVRGGRGARSERPDRADRRRRRRVHEGASRCGRSAGSARSRARSRRRPSSASTSALLLIWTRRAREGRRRSSGSRSRDEPGSIYARRPEVPRGSRDRHGTK